MFDLNNRPAFIAVALSVLLLSAPSFAQTASPASNVDTSKGANGEGPSQPGAVSGTNEMAPTHAQATQPQPAPNAMAPSAMTPSARTTPRAQMAATPRKDDVEGRIKRMHDRLKITADQESDWAPVAAAMRDNSQSIQPLVMQRDQNYRTMNAVDNLKSYEAITTAHADGLKKLETAFAKLYGNMTDAQKKNADNVFRNIAARQEKTHKPAAAPKTNG